MMFNLYTVFCNNSIMYTEYSIYFTNGIQSYTKSTESSEVSFEYIIIFSKFNARICRAISVKIKKILTNINCNKIINMNFLNQSKTEKEEKNYDGIILRSDSEDVTGNPIFGNILSTDSLEVPPPRLSTTARPIRIDGITVTRLVGWNGIYDPTSESNSGMTLYQQREDINHWLENISSAKKWVLHETSNKGKNICSVASPTLSTVDRPEKCVGDSKSSWRAFDGISWSDLPNFILSPEDK